MSHSAIAIKSRHLAAVHNTPGADSNLDVHSFNFDVSLCSFITFVFINIDGWKVESENLGCVVFLFRPQSQASL